MANPLIKLMPTIHEHAGLWEGEYQVVDLQGKVIDQHKSRVECVFPEQGEVVYIQRNHFIWDDGREYKVEFGGVLIEDRIFWDTDTFTGFGWQAAPNIFLLELDRKDVEGASFSEAIVMGKSKRDRARTWHWFQQGKCYQRTLCNEWLVG